MSPGEGEVAYASVAVPVPVRRLFTYSVGQALQSRIEQGSRVRVRFGHRQVVGTVVEWPAPVPEATVDIRPIESLAGEARRLPPELLELTRFVADYYLSSWGEAIETALPADPGPEPTVRFLRRTSTAPDPATLPERSVARRRVLEAIPASGEAVPVTVLTPRDRRVAQELARAGWLEVEQRPVTVVDEGPGEVGAGDPALHPTPRQAKVFEELLPRIDEGRFSTCLLYGATGSGKTEVYFRAAERALRRGAGVIYLVPEIGLTPLLLTKISRRFPGEVALLHSGLSKRERFASWRSVLEGRARLVVGTRSAVFAPVRKLGLIVVDEEQDGSYKQEETPRYNARDLAIVRAQSEGALVLLGSATPSMESFEHARSGRYTLLRLGDRVESRPMPEVELVDMRTEYRQGREIKPLSERLIARLKECVDRGDQALILRNRRGWAAAVFCPTCGDRVSCTRCSISMTWHRSEQRLRCHYCGAAERFPVCCPKCAAENLNLLGEGSERIEDLVGRELPGAVVERMDRDSIRRRGAHEALLRRFEREEIQVLVGTQMIAKGHDFPRVTLVGVLSADQPLGLPDFRAGERVFQLLTQVAGRAGRGERPGRVVIQAFDPEHPLLRQAARQDYEPFFEREIVYRRALRYPPLAALVQIILHDPDEFKVRDWGEQLADSLRRASDGSLLIGGPGPAPIERLKGRYRRQILIRTTGRRKLIAAVEKALAGVEGKIPRRAMQVDVDPYSLL